MQTPTGVTDGHGVQKLDIQRHGIDKLDIALKTQSTDSSELGWKFGVGVAAPWRINAGVYPFLYWE